MQNGPSKNSFNQTLSDCFKFGHFLVFLFANYNDSLSVPLTCFVTILVLYSSPIAISLSLSHSYSLKSQSQIQLNESNYCCLKLGPRVTENHSVSSHIPHVSFDTEVFYCGTAQPEVRYVHDTLYSGKVTRYLQVCLTCSRKWQNPDTFLAL